MSRSCTNSLGWKDPKSEDYTKLEKFDCNNASPWLKEQAEAVLLWALDHPNSTTFPRDDNRGLLELVIDWLVGHVSDYKFYLPGPDHHARWMAKAIYFMKLAFIGEQFVMNKREMNSMVCVSEFVGLFYVKYFLTSSLSSQAPLNDLTLMQDLLEYRSLRPVLAEACQCKGIGGYSSWQC